jgi:hypothetical protein
MDGLQATRQILSAAARPDRPRVLMLTTFDLDDYVYEALRAGASGFLLKDATAAELVHAVRVVAAGDALLAPSVTRRLIADFARRLRPDPPSPPSLGALTQRETEVLRLIAHGLSNAEISNTLVIAGQTTKTRRPHPGQARPPRPRPGRRPRLRNRPRYTWRIRPRADKPRHRARTVTSSHHAVGTRAGPGSGASDPPAAHAQNVQIGTVPVLIAIWQAPAQRGGSARALIWPSYHVVRFLPSLASTARWSVSPAYLYRRRRTAKARICRVLRVLASRTCGDAPVISG